MQKMDYLTLAKQFKGRKCGKQIAKILLKNAKRKGAVGAAPLDKNENNLMIG